MTLSRRVMWSLVPAALAIGTVFAQQTAAGVVFDDANGNGRRDAGEAGVAGIRVSNQREVVKTDGDGRYSLPVGENTVLFVVKPCGWAVPVDANNIPRYYYIHNPAGTPPRKYAGVSPTGPLPASVDFPLRKSAEPDKFSVAFLGDTQTTNVKETQYLAHDVAEEVVDAGASFGVTLGDVANNDLSIFPQNAAVMGRIGIPWRNVPGNHDLNHDTPNDEDSAETFRRNYGPEYYSFDYGSVHFIAFEDIKWNGKGYTAWLGPKQLEFIKNDLAFVPKSKLVVLMMHIPLTELEDKKALFALLSDRTKLFAITGHYHTMDNRLLGKDAGWNGAKPLNMLINGTSCGGWWTGAYDEYGLPQTTMSDGTPNGYAVVSFTGSKYSVRWKCARRPAEFQMSVFAPEVVAKDELGKTEAVANVFLANPKDSVEMRVDGAAWTPMTRNVRKDPFVEAAVAAETGPNPPSGPKLPDAEDCTHIWVTPLPTTLAVGMHRLDVRWQGSVGHRIFEVK